MMNTAVAAELILRNPCRIDGAGRESAPERPIATLAELELLVTAMPARFRAMILLACWCHLRKGELCALRRRDVDLVVQCHGGPVPPAAPQRDAGHQGAKDGGRPAHRGHPAACAAGADDASGDVHRRRSRRPGVHRRAWRPTATARPPEALARARLAAGRPDLHLHDLRHTGSTWAAATGASTRELAWPEWATPTRTRHCATSTPPRTVIGSSPTR